LMSVRCGRGHGERRRGEGVRARRRRGSTGARRDYGEGGKATTTGRDVTVAVRVCAAVRCTEEGAGMGGCRMRRGKEVGRGGQTEENGHMQLLKMEIGPTRQAEKREKSLRLHSFDRTHRCSSPDAMCPVWNREVQGCSRRDRTRSMLADRT
jgi:hypothetical protein